VSIDYESGAITAWLGHARYSLLDARYGNQFTCVRSRPIITPWMISSVAGNRSG
jgi:hypothetical protein